MKKLVILFLLIGIFSCSSTQKITQVEFDSAKQLYLASVEGKPGKVYLRDDHSNLIRTEKEKDSFISRNNYYWQMDRDAQTNA